MLYWSVFEIWKLLHAKRVWARLECPEWFLIIVPYEVFKAKTTSPIGAKKLVRLTPRLVVTYGHGYLLVTKVIYLFSDCQIKPSKMPRLTLIPPVEMSMNSKDIVQVGFYGRIL